MLSGKHGAEMLMYTVQFTRDGEAVARFHTHAADEAGAQAHAMAFFREHPEHDPFAGDYDGMSIHVEVYHP